MRRWAVALLLALAAPVVAQPVADAPEQTPVLTISPDRLFADTLYGRAVQARIDEASRALVDENRRSEADLAAEEQALTQRRATVPPAEFRVLAEAFDQKANGIRETQTGKARAITEMRDAERQRFFEAVLPVLGQIMRDFGAVAIIDQSSVFLSFDRIDITTTAIARIDTLLGDGPDDPPTGDRPAARPPGLSGSQTVAPDAPAPAAPARPADP